MMLMPMHSQLPFAERRLQLAVLPRRTPNAACGSTRAARGWVAAVAYTAGLPFDISCRNPAGQNLMLALNYVYHGEARLVCEAHEQWGASFQALHPQLPPLGLGDVDASEGRPLVVSIA